MKDLEAMAGKAGTRNEGREIEGANTIALSNPFDLAVDSIANRLQGTVSRFSIFFSQVWVGFFLPEASQGEVAEFRMIS